MPYNPYAYQMPTYYGQPMPDNLTQLRQGVGYQSPMMQQLFAAQLAASQAAQNETLKAYMSGQLAYYNPRPVPAFQVPAPYQYGNCGTGCGCGSCA